MSASVWRIRKLGAVASMHARIGWQNLRTTEFLDSGDYYLITGTDFKDGHVNFDTCHYVEKRRFDQDINIQLQVGSILITKDGTLGKVAYIDKLNKPATLNAGVFNVIVRDPQTDEKYLFHLLKSPSLMNYATIKSTGGTIKHLNQNVLVKFPVVLPKDIQEQKHISDILSTCDTVIQNTQKTIDKYKAIKQGMMQDLFTRGLTKDGKLRPSYKEAPELYKESELGMIPKEWEVKRIDAIFTLKVGGDLDVSCYSTYKDEYHLYPIYSNGLENKGLYGFTSTPIFKKESVTITGRGTLGHAEYRNIDFDAIIRIVILEKTNIPINGFFISEYINYKIPFYFEVTSIPQLTAPSVGASKVIYPTIINEQIAIENRLSSIDSTIQKEEAILEKYKKIKTGLMARLLTPPEDAEIIDETGETL